MSGIPGIPSGGGSGDALDFNRRIQEALERAKQKAAPKVPAATTPAAALPGAPTSLQRPESSADAFNQRLAAALSQARGEAPTGQPETAGPQAPSTRRRPTDDRRTGPVGQGDHVVREGECMASIALYHGYFWETIWNDPANVELKETRQNPNVLLPADRVTIPEKRRKNESIVAEKRHRFVRRGEPASVRLRFHTFGKPRRGEDYELFIDDLFVRDGKLDHQGGLDCPIRSDAREAQVYVYDADGHCDEFRVALGKIPPISEPCGLQARLNNLGFVCGEDAERITPMIRAALKAFQREQELEPTGEADDRTRARLVEVHGC